MRDLELELTAASALDVHLIALGDSARFTDSELGTLRELQSTKERRQLAKEGKAHPDGSFPIKNVPALKRAISAYGRSKNKNKTRNLIIRRARGLGRTDLLPESWGVRGRDDKKNSKGKTKKAATASGAVVAAGTSNGVMIAAYPPPEIAQTLAGPEDGDHPPEELHVTLAYFGTTSDVSSDQLELLRRALFEVTGFRSSTFPAKIDGVGTFDAPQGDRPRWYGIEAPGLRELRYDVVRAAEKVGVQPSMEHDFNPHMTVRYGGDPVAEVPEGGDASWPVDALVLVHGGTREVFPLGHDFAPPDDSADTCELCGRPSSATVHDNEKLPQYLDEMDGDEGSTDDSVDTTPKPVQDLAKAIARGGSGTGAAVDIASSRVKDLADNAPDAKTKAKYAAIVAEWEAQRARAEADSAASELRSSFGRWAMSTGALRDRVPSVFAAIMDPTDPSEEYAERSEFEVDSVETDFHESLDLNVEDAELANNLEEYWKRGKGAAKIRWGTDGDWTRCHRFLKKHVGDERARRICAKWHHDMTGMWPGDKKNKGKDKKASATTSEEFDVVETVEEFDVAETTERSATASAAAWSEDGEHFWDDETNVVYKVDETSTVQRWDAGENSWVPDDSLDVGDVEMFPTVDDPETMEAIVAAGTEGTPEVPEEAGRRFKIDLVIPEGIPSGDSRSFSEGALESLEPPFPLFWQKVSDDGHKQSVTVGKFTKIERTEAGLGNAEGVFDTHPDAVEAARQVEGQFLLGVSGDVDQFKSELSTDDNGEESMLIHHGRLVGATLVGKPAFQECRIELLSRDGEETTSVTAAGGPTAPPSEWFRNPELTGPTRLVVEEGGRVYGHIATWGTKHTGNPALTPPRSTSDYKFFKTGVVRTADGFDVSVGQLTLAGGHAGLTLSADRATRHYDDTKSAVADVTCGEDEFGIWVAGSARPGISEHQLYAFRASAPSGDWRKLEDNLELIAVCQVNTPGFPVPKTLVASGECMALVAAGTPELMPEVLTVSPEIERRLADVEKFVADQRATAVLSSARSAMDALRGG